MSSSDKNKEEKQSVFTRETLGVVLILFAFLCLVCVITREKVFGELGVAVNSFFLGLFGYFTYAVLIWFVILGVLLVTGKKIKMQVKNKLLITGMFFVLALVSQIISTFRQFQDFDFSGYISSVYDSASGGISTCSAGGVATSLVSYWLSFILSEIGSLVVLSIFFFVMGYFFVRNFIKNKKAKEKPQEPFKTSFVKEESGDTEKGEEQYEKEGEKSLGVEPVTSVTKPTQRLFIAGEENFELKTKKELNSKISENVKFEKVEDGLNIASSYTETYTEDLKNKIEYIKTPAEIDVEKTINKDYSSPTVSDYVAPIGEQQKDNKDKEEEIPFIDHQEETDKPNEEENFNSLNKFSEYASNEEIEDFSSNEEYEKEEIFREFKESDTEVTDSNQGIEEEKEVPFIHEENETYENPAPSVIRERRSIDIFGAESKDDNSTNKFDEFKDKVFGNSSTEVEQEKAEEEKPIKKEIPINREYFRPPLDLLENYSQAVDSSEENHEENMEIIKQTLADFHINVETQGYVQGPSVTRYEIMMPAGVPVRKIVNYDDDFRMRLASRNGVRIEAPIPGKNLVGIEVANKHPVTVGLKSILEETVNKPCKPGSLIFAIGKNIVGEAITDNLAKGPHFLVAGSTGSGKSVCLNVMIVSLIMRYSPEELRLILVDPKGNEFRPYEHIPHLMVDEIITQPQKALAALLWAHDEMERRYKVLEECGGIRDIDVYNQTVANDKVAKMPRIVIIVDELSNLMDTCKKDMEARILSIAQKARAVGIHLVLATQRPSVDVITGTIKANLPSRIALKVTNFADSNTILSEGGAEKLLGHGDMLYKNNEMGEYERYQGAWISDGEINNIVNYIKEKNACYFDDELKDFLDKSVSPKSEEIEDDGEEADEESSDLFIKALWFAVNFNAVSISALQRRFGIGYAKAGRLVDIMERKGFVSGNEGAKARRVLISREEFEDKFGPMSDL